ncbi:sulfite exporter TauE/SafE family protein [Bathymodiolus platifrons methanotrophic gill symbiont]|uniref:sulfite exporter TauE/SafE family protein n=1 Tax=Bathymodiolus platifrons methanotrophic gill symbiont TaxID=113268 RepID=UPI000B417967|nr:sulfite exporter TauE/SafE family protein [Bathymodiolus platifrons methanotrophic gill symbiont]
MLLVSCLAILIGVLLGGGGSILTVPVLVYLAEIPAKSAIVTSLIVVGSTSIIATINHSRMGSVCWKTGAVFGSSGMLGAYLGGRLTVYVPEALLLVLLGIVMLAASFSMILSKKQPEESCKQLDDTPICPTELPVFAILLDGFFLGIITGLVGVGGGFLLVPALTHLASLPVHAAIGTSLCIITLQSTAGLFGHAGHINIDLEITVLVTILAIIGSFFGSKAAHYIPASYLKTGFGYFVLILGSFLLYKEVNQEIILQIQNLVEENQQFIIGASSVILFSFTYRIWVWLHTKKSKI